MPTGTNTPIIKKKQIIGDDDTYIVKSDGSMLVETSAVRIDSSNRIGVNVAPNASRDLQILSASDSYRGLHVEGHSSSHSGNLVTFTCPLTNTGTFSWNGNGFMQSLGEAAAAWIRRNDGNAPNLSLIRDTAVPGAANVVLSNQFFYGSVDGGTLREGGRIWAVSEGAWTAGTSHPTHLRLGVTLSGGTTSTERARVTQKGLHAGAAPSTTPVAALAVNGTIEVKSVSYLVNATINPDNGMICYCQHNSVVGRGTFTLPAAASYLNTLLVIIRDFNSTSNPVINAGGSDNIRRNGADVTTITLTDTAGLRSLTLVSDGVSRWYVIGSH
jgi:hypothetical protein